MHFRLAVTRLARALLDRIRDARVVDSATAAAFWLFLSLLPIAAVAAMIVANIAIADVSILDSWFAAVPASARDLFTKELHRVAELRHGAGTPLTALVFIYLASTGIHAIFDAFDTTMRCTRSWLRKRLLAIAVCVGLSIVVALVGLVAGEVKREVSSSLVNFFSHGVAGVMTAFVVELALVLTLFVVGLAPERKTMPIFPGAIVAAVLHMIFAWSYVLYVEHVGSGSAYEAGLATIGVTMTVVFLFTLALLLGVTVNAVLGTEVAKRHANKPAPDASTLADVARAEGEGMGQPQHQH
jgi:membrane protein